MSADVLVRFEASGTTYRTDTIRFGDTAGSGDMSVADVWLFRYPEGKQVRVFYHPSDATLAVLRPGFSAEALALPLGGLFCVLVGVMFWNAARNGATAAAVTVFASIFMLAGMGLLILGALNLWRGWRSESWPIAEGDIIRSDTSTSFDRTTHTSSTSPVTVYRYSAAGETRYGNQRRFGQIAGSSDSDWAADIAEQYPQGEKFPVRYDPADPDLSVLEPGIGGETWIAPAIGLVVFLFGFAAMRIIVPSLRKGF